jgi:hypothetical protein
MEKPRNDEKPGRHGREEGDEPKSFQRNGGNKKSSAGIDYDQLLVDAAQFLNVYDIDLIYSWTPREFKNFLKGASLQRIDAQEHAAIQAIFYAKVKSKKRINGVKDIYDAEKARKEMLKGTTKAEPLHTERYEKAKKAMELYNTGAFKQKGG